MAYIRRKCDDRNTQFNAFASRNMIYLCIGKHDLSKLSQDQRLLYFLETALVHEIFHVIQSEYAADREARFYRKGSKKPRLYLYPSWMVEGTADYFTQKYLIEKHNIPSVGLRYVFKAASEHKQKLSEIRQNASLSDEDDYQVSRLAAHLLALRHGDKALLAYWQRVGFGLSHEAAFEATFGQSMQAFEKEFETLRSNLNAALTYGNK